MIIAFCDWLVRMLSEPDYENRSTYPTLFPIKENMYHDISDDHHDMEENAIAEVDSEVLDLEQHELDHDVAFVLHKRVSCFAHTLQLVVHEETKVCI